MRSELLFTRKPSPWKRFGSTTLALLIASAGVGGAIRIVRAQDKPAQNVAKPAPNVNVTIAATARTPQQNQEIAIAALAPAQENKESKDDAKARKEMEDLLRQRGELDAKIRALRSRLGDRLAYRIVTPGGGQNNLRIYRSNRDEKKLTPEERKQVDEALKKAEEAMKQARKALEGVQKFIPNDLPLLFGETGRAFTIPPMPRVAVPSAPLNRFRFDSGDAKDWEEWSKKYQEEWKRFQPEFDKKMREFQKRMEQWQRDFEKRMQERSRERNRESGNRKGGADLFESEVEETEREDAAPIIIEKEIEESSDSDVL